MGTHMKLILTAVAVVLLAGCATGEAYRTTTKGRDGDTITCEMKRSGYFFASGANALVCRNDDTLEIK